MTGEGLRRILRFFPTRTDKQFSPSKGTLIPSAQSVRTATASVADQDDTGILEESRRLGPIVAELVHDVGRCARAGTTTQSIADTLVSRSITQSLLPAMMGYNGFPGSAAISLNEEVLHGVPSKRKTAEFDLLKIEYGVVSGRAFASHSWTFPVGTPRSEDRILLEVGQKALRAAIDVVKPRNRLGDIGAAIQQTIESAGLSVVRSFVGYGMGRLRIQEPQIPGYGVSGRGARIKAGWILNLHVIVKPGVPSVLIADNDWTALSEDGRNAALFSCMVEVTADGCSVLTTLPQLGPA